MNLLAEAAEWICGVSASRTPPEVVSRVQTLLLYTLTLAVASHDETDALWLAARRASTGGGRSALLVTGERWSAENAAFINAVIGCRRGQNDTYPAATAHAGCIVVPAVLALARERGLGGAAVLDALLVGYEALPKLAADIAPVIVKRGFRATGVFGPLIAAAAASRLIGLSAAQTAHALAIATMHSGGTMQCWEEGTPEWRLQVANASRSGIVAAKLAEAGATAAAGSLDGNSGLYKVYAGAVPAIDFNGWKLRDTVVKPYPGCLINQAAVYMVNRIMNRESLASSTVEAVTVTLSEANARYPGIDQYGPFLQPTGAIMSMAFMVETALEDGTVRMSHFNERHAEHPVHKASRRVTLRSDPGLPQWGCRVRMVTRSGQVFEDEAADQSMFALGWQDTVDLLGGVVDEWPVPDAGQRFKGLTEAVSALAEQGEVDSFGAFCMRASAGG
ncbi:MmgE/PrpD family protein [soil metagenome]